MKQNEKNEELQSRRQFFKKAARRMLPIVGIMALSNIPIISSASRISSGGCDGCKGECMRGCKSGCGSGCGNTCLKDCQGKTYNTHGTTSSGYTCDDCLSACKGCNNGCHSSCSGSCKYGSNGTY